MPTTVKSTVLLLAWLRNMGLGLPEGSSLQSRHRSRAQAAAHAWAWEARGPGGEALGIGSEWQVGKLLACKALEVTEDGDGRQHIAPTIREQQRIEKIKAVKQEREKKNVL